jgi:hypothetical protein
MNESMNGLSIIWWLIFSFCFCIIVTEEPENQAPAEKKNDNVENVQQQVVKKTEAPKQDDQPISSNAFASGANMNGAQVMTGRPSCRVLAPPGGHTNWSLG